MKDSELRLGNFVHSIVNERCNKMNRGILQLDSRALGYIFETEDYEGVEPIPLTEDWLLKFGFNTNGDKWWIDNANVDLYIMLASDGNYEVYHEMDYMLDIVYVHQLQNLYFALTGEELNLK